MRISDWSSDVCSSDLAARCSISGHYGSLLMACSYSPMMTADMKNDTYTGTGLPLKLDMMMPNPIATDTAPICPRRTSLRMLRSAEHTSDLQSLMRISYAVFCL